MGDKDKLVIKRDLLRNMPERNLTVPVDTYNKVKQLASISNLRIAEVLSLMVDFASERVEIID